MNQYRYEKVMQKKHYVMFIFRVVGNNIEVYSLLVPDGATSDHSTLQLEENNSPRADPQLVRLLKSVDGHGTAVQDSEILKYIREVLLKLIFQMNF